MVCVSGSCISCDCAVCNILAIYCRNVCSTVHGITSCHNGSCVTNVASVFSFGNRVCCLAGNTTNDNGLTVSEPECFRHRSVFACSQHCCVCVCGVVEWCYNSRCISTREINIELRSLYCTCQSDSEREVFVTRSLITSNCLADSEVGSCINSLQSCDLVAKFNCGIKLCCVCIFIIVKNVTCNSQSACAVIFNVNVTSKCTVCNCFCRAVILLDSTLFSNALNSTCFCDVITVNARFLKGYVTEIHCCSLYDLTLIRAGTIYTTVCVACSECDISNSWQSVCVNAVVTCKHIQLCRAVACDCCSTRNAVRICDIRYVRFVIEFNSLFKGSGCASNWCVVLTCSKDWGCCRQNHSSTHSCSNCSVENAILIH